MKKILSFFVVLLILINVVPLYSFANVNEYEYNYYNVSIPIFQGTTEDISSEILNGITSTNDEKENIVFVNIQDFLRLSNTQISSESANSIKINKNTVFLEINWDNSTSILSLGYNESEIVKSFKIDVPFIKYKGEYYISFTHSLNAFGIKMNIIDKDNMSNFISVNNKMLNEDNEKEGIYYLENSKILDFNTYPQYLLISNAEPFDKFYSEYRNCSSEYQFSWNQLPWYLNDTTASAFSFESYYFNGYKGLTDYIIGDYDSEKRYYDIILEIISNETFGENSDEKPIDISLISNLINCTNDILSFAKEIEPSTSFVFSSVSDVIQIPKKIAQLINCSQFQKNVISCTLLSSDRLQKELINDKMITDGLKTPLFAKYMIKTYESAIFNNQYALFKSSEKAIKDITNPSNNITIDSIKNIVYNGLTTISDDKLAGITGGATEIPDILMKTIKYTPGIDSLLSASEKLGKVKDCYFIQETLRNLCTKDIFEDSENEYYNVRFILQSSLTAYELLLDSGTVINQEDKEFIKQKCNKISDMITNLKACNIKFYSTDKISEELKDLNKLFIYNNNDLDSNYTWYIAPTIEAEDIIVSDDSVYTLYESVKSSDTYSIVKRDEKYTMIDYDGNLLSDDYYDSYYFADAGEIGLWRYNTSPYSFMAYGDSINKDDYGMARGATGGYNGFYYDKTDNTIYADRFFEIEVYNGLIQESENKEVKRAVLIEEANVTADNYDIEHKSKYGIAFDNNITVNTIYSDGRMSLYNDIIALKNNDKWGYFNGQTGKQIIDFKCNDVNSNKYTTSWDYNENNMAIEKTHKIYPYAFTDGYVALYTDDGCGYYNTQGKEVIPVGTFEEVRPVHNGLAWVKKDGKWGVIELNSTDTDENNQKEEIHNNFNIKDYQGTWHPVNSDYYVSVDISNICENSATIYIEITNNKYTHISENTYTGDINTNTITFETQDGWGKNEFTLKFKDGKIYLTGRCIQSDSHIWQMPNISNIEMKLDETSWKQLYADELKKYINSNEYNSEAMFDLYDINIDDIPELIISEGTPHIRQCIIYTITNGKLIKSDRKYGEYGTVSCSQSKKTLFSGTMFQGHSTFSYNQLINGEFTCMITGYNDAGDVGEESATYKINDNIVTFEKYEEEISKYNADDYISVGRKYKLDETTVNSVLLDIQADNSKISGKISVSDGYLNVRDKPSTDGKIIGKLYNDTIIKIISETDGWYEIEHDNIHGYVSKKYITLIETTETDSSTTQTTISDDKILNAVNRYLKENQNKLDNWFNSSYAYCQAEYIGSNDTNWACPINLSWESYSEHTIAGSYPEYAYVNKNTLQCTLTYNYDTVVEFNLSDYL